MGKETRIDKRELPRINDAMRAKERENSGDLVLEVFMLMGCKGPLVLRFFFGPFLCSHSPERSVDC